MADKDKLKKLSTSAEANRKKAEAIIKRRFPNINEKGMEAILRNIGIETSFNSTNGQEKPWTPTKIAAAGSRYTTIKSNYQKFLNTKKPVSLLTPGATTTTAGPQTQSAVAAGNYTEADYNALSVDEQLSVMYWGNKDEKFAGGLGALQVTSGSKATSVEKYKKMLDATSSSMGITTDDLLVKLKAGDFEAGTEFSLEYYQKHKGTAHNWTAEKLNNTTALGLRTQARGINPGEDNDILSPLLTDYSHTNNDAAADSLVRRLEWLDEAYYKNGYVVSVSDTNAPEEEKKLSTLRQDVLTKAYEKLDKNPSELPQEQIDDLKLKIKKKITASTSTEEITAINKMSFENIRDSAAREDQVYNDAELQRQIQVVLDNPEEYTVEQTEKAEEINALLKTASKDSDDLEAWNVNNRENRRKQSAGSRSINTRPSSPIKKRIENSRLRLSESVSDEFLESIRKIEQPVLTDEQVSKDQAEVNQAEFDALTEVVDSEESNDEVGNVNDDGLIEIEEEEEESETLEEAGLKAPETPEQKAARIKAARKEKIAKLANVLGQAGKTAGVALMAGAGLKSMFEATKLSKTNKIRVSPLMQEAFQKAKALSTQGMTYEERTAAMSDMNNAYAGAMKNVMAISGGQRSTALANMGVVDASRVNALVDLAGKDAALRQGNMKIYQQQATSLGNMTLTADSTNEQLKAKLEEGRKNRLTKIGESLYTESLELSRNFADQRNNKDLVSTFAELQSQINSSKEEQDLIKNQLSSLYGK